ncbi:hypothetical protein BGZ83_006673, partial [Gryganskiella cystojenkinii]
MPPLFSIFEICSHIALFLCYHRNRDLHALTLVCRQFHQSFNPLLWKTLNINIDLPITVFRQGELQCFPRSRHKQQPTDKALSTLGHLVRVFKLTVFKENASTYILDLMQLHCKNLVNVKITNLFMTVQEFNDQIMDSPSALSDLELLFLDGDNVNTATLNSHDNNSTNLNNRVYRDHGLLSNTITSLQFELAPSVIREVFDQLIQVRNESDQEVLANLVHFRVVCEELKLQTEAEVRETKELSLFTVHAFLNTFPNLETLSTGFMLVTDGTSRRTTEIGESEAPPQSLGHAWFSHRLQSLDLTPDNPWVLLSLLLRTRERSRATLSSSPPEITSKATRTTSSLEFKGLRKLGLGYFLDNSPMAAVGAFGLSELEHLSFTFQGQRAQDASRLVLDNDQNLVSFWKTLPRLRVFKTSAMLLSAEACRSLVECCPRLAKIECTGLYQRAPVIRADWGGPLEMMRGGAGLRTLDISHHVGVRFFHRLMRHPSPLATLLAKGRLTEVEEGVGANITTGPSNGEPQHQQEQEASDEGSGALEGVEAQVLESNDTGGIEDEDDDDDDDDGDYVPSENDGESDEEEGAEEEDDDLLMVDHADLVDDDETEDEQERLSLSMLKPDQDCFKTLETLTLQQVTLQGATQNHIFRQAIRLLTRLRSLRVCAFGLQKWAFLEPGEVSLGNNATSQHLRPPTHLGTDKTATATELTNSSQDRSKIQYPYPCLQELSFSIFEITEEDFVVMVALMPKLSFYLTYRLQLNGEALVKIRN